MGRDIAPNHILYEDDFGSEIVYRQPKNPSETHLVLTVAWNNPYGVKNGGPNVAAWIRGLQCQWSSSELADERENAAGPQDFARHLDDGLEAHLREYGFWLDNRRLPLAYERLPRLHQG